jgi:hypothetical protein
VIETEIRRRFIFAAVKAYPDRVRLYTRNVGVFKLEGGRFFRAAIKGQADVWGYYRSDCACEASAKAGAVMAGMRCGCRGKGTVTRPIEIEIKRHKRRELDESQEQWRTHCLAWGITYIQLTEAKNETDCIPRFVQELGEVIG